MRLHRPFIVVILILLALTSLLRLPVFSISETNREKKQTPTTRTIKLCARWLLGDLPLDEITFVVLGITPIEHERKIRILAFVEGYDMSVGGGDRVQAYPSRLSTELDVNLSYDGQEIYNYVRRYAWDVNHFDCSLPPGGLQEIFGAHGTAVQQTWTLSVSRMSSTILKLDVCSSIQTPVSVGICSATLYGDKIQLRHIVDWAEYHRLLGVGLITLYMRSDTYRRLESEVRKTFQGFVIPFDIGVISRDPLSASRHNGYYDQEMALNHCLFNARGKVEWLGIFDIDEYVYSPDHDQLVNLLRLLRKGNSACIHIEQDYIVSPTIDWNALPAKTVYQEMKDPKYDKFVLSGLPKMFCKPMETKVIANHGSISATMPTKANQTDIVFRHYLNLLHQRTVPIDERLQNPAKRKVDLLFGAKHQEAVNVLLGTGTS
jgi:hypothetical protein